MFLWCVKVLFFCLSCFVFVTNADLKYNQRQGRIFTFDLENEDVDVSLDFAIPFIKIPIKKTLNAITGHGGNQLNFPNININPMALGLGGLLIVFTTFLIPILKKTLGFQHFDRSSRDEYFNKYAPFDISENLIANSRRCPERLACWASQQSISPAVIETWKQIMSNTLLSAIVNTTVLEAASIKGLKGQNCESYTPCPIEENSLPKIIKSFETLTNSRFP